MIDVEFWWFLLIHIPNMNTKVWNQIWNRLLPSSQDPATGPYAQQYEASP
jgi:hypothetical protein